MGYSASFLCNKTYGVEHLNEISERLVGKGVNTVAVDGDFYNAEDLNKITEDLTESGVTHNAHSCRVIKYDTNRFKILGGSAFFSNGLAIDVDSEGVMLDILNGDNYIFFKYDEQNKTGYPVVSNSVPGIYDIPLAEHKSGVLTDVRPRAVSKIEGFGTNTYFETDYTFSAVEVKVPAYADGRNVYKVGTINVENADKFSRVMVYANDNTMSASGKIATSLETGDGDYSYGYCDKGYSIVKGGYQTDFMIYGREGSGKIYAFFIPSANGFDIYFTVERAAKINYFNATWKIIFC